MSFTEQEKNKMSINLFKTVELVFRRPNVSDDLLPPALPDINRVCDAELLGVYFCCIDYRTLVYILLVSVIAKEMIIRFII